MSKESGSLSLNNGFEVLKAFPLDDRSISKTISDLIDPNRWVCSDGNTYYYSGMLVTITDESDDSLNGTYRYLGGDITDLNNWKLDSTVDHESLQILSTSVNDYSNANTVTLSEDESVLNISSSIVTNTRNKKIVLPASSIVSSKLVDGDNLVIYNNETDSYDVIPATIEGTGDLIEFTAPNLSNNGIPYIDVYAVSANAEHDSTSLASAASTGEAVKFWSPGSFPVSVDNPIYYNMHFKHGLILKKLSFINRNFSLSEYLFPPKTIDIEALVNNEWVNLTTYTNTVLTSNASWELLLTDNEIISKDIRIVMTETTIIGNVIPSGLSNELAFELLNHRYDFSGSTPVFIEDTIITLDVNRSKKVLPQYDTPILAVVSKTSTSITISNTMIRDIPYLKTINGNGLKGSGDISVKELFNIHNINNNSLWDSELDIYGEEMVVLTDEVVDLADGYINIPANTVSDTNGLVRSLPSGEVHTSLAYESIGYVVYNDETKEYDYAPASDSETILIPLESKVLTGDEVRYVDDYAVAANSIYNSNYSVTYITRDTPPANGYDCWYPSATPCNVYLFFNVPTNISILKFINRNYSTVLALGSFTIYGNKINESGSEVWEVLGSFTNTVKGQAASWEIDLSNTEYYYSYRIYSTATFTLGRVSYVGAQIVDNPIKGLVLSRVNNRMCFTRDGIIESKYSTPALALIYKDDSNVITVKNHKQIESNALANKLSLAEVNNTSLISGPFTIHGKPLEIINETIMTVTDTEISLTSSIVSDINGINVTLPESTIAILNIPNTSIIYNNRLKTYEYVQFDGSSDILNGEVPIPNLSIKYIDGLPRYTDVSTNEIVTDYTTPVMVSVSSIAGIVSHNVVMRAITAGAGIELSNGIISWSPSLVEATHTYDLVDYDNPVTTTANTITAPYDGVLITTSLRSYDGRVYIGINGITTAYVSCPTRNYSSNISVRLNVKKGDKIAITGSKYSTSKLSIYPYDYSKRKNSLGQTVINSDVDYDNMVIVPIANNSDTIVTMPFDGVLIPDVVRAIATMGVSLYINSVLIYSLPGFTQNEVVKLATASIPVSKGDIIKFTGGLDSTSAYIDYATNRLMLVPFKQYFVDKEIPLEPYQYDYTDRLLITTPHNTPYLWTVPSNGFFTTTINTYKGSESYIKLNGVLLHKHSTNDQGFTPANISMEVYEGDIIELFNSYKASTHIDYIMFYSRIGTPATVIKVSPYEGTEILGGIRDNNINGRTASSVIDIQGDSLVLLRDTLNVTITDTISIEKCEVTDLYGVVTEIPEGTLTIPTGDFTEKAVIYNNDTNSYDLLDMIVSEGLVDVIALDKTSFRPKYINTITNEVYSNYTTPILVSIQRVSDVVSVVSTVTLGGVASKLLPATTEEIGGIKVGRGLEIDSSGVLSTSLNTINGIELNTNTDIVLPTHSEVELMINTSGDSKPVTSGLIPYSIYNISADTSITIVDKSITVSKLLVVSNSGVLKTLESEIIDTTDMPVGSYYVAYNDNTNSFDLVPLISGIETPRPTMGGSISFPKLTALGTPYVDDYAIMSSTISTETYPILAVTDASVGIATDSWYSTAKPTEASPANITMYYKTPKMITSFLFVNRDGTNVGSFGRIAIQASLTNVVGEEEWITLKEHTNTLKLALESWTVDLDPSVCRGYYSYRIVIYTTNDSWLGLGLLKPTGYDYVESGESATTIDRNARPISISSNIIELDGSNSTTVLSMYTTPIVGLVNITDVEVTLDYTTPMNSIVDAMDDNDVVYLFNRFKQLKLI